MNKKMQLYNRLHKLNTAQIITLGFAGVIILGGLLLWLPFCTAPGNHTSFTDAMFTATTSVCVTGLVTVVTATHWTLAGKIIILVLIQIGGVGLISLGSIIFISLRKKISLRNRRVIQESYNMDRMGVGAFPENFEPFYNYFTCSVQLCDGRVFFSLICLIKLVMNKDMIFDADG